MGSHSVTCHPTQVHAPRLTPAMQAGTRFTYPWGMEGWVDLVDLIAPRPEVKPATFRSRLRRRTVAPPRQPSWPLVLVTRKPTIHKRERTLSKTAAVISVWIDLVSCIDEDNVPVFVYLISSLNLPLLYVTLPDTQSIQLPDRKSH